MDWLFYIEILGAFFAILGVFLLSFAKGKLFFLSFLSYIIANTFLLIFSSYFHLSYLFLLMLFFLSTAILGFYNNFNILKISNFNKFGFNFEMRKLVTFLIITFIILILFLLKDFIFIDLNNLELSKFEVFKSNFNSPFNDINNNKLKLLECSASLLGIIGSILISIKNPNKILAFSLFILYDILILIFYIFFSINNNGDFGIFFIVQALLALILNIVGFKRALTIEKL